MSAERGTRKLFRGLIPATLTPMHEDGSVNFARIPDIVDFMHGQKLSALYVLGSSGEAVSLTLAERKAVAEAYIDAAKGKMPVIVQVGHNCLDDAKELAAHSAAAGAAAISAIPPNFFKPAAVQDLVDCISAVAGAAPECPFYYYHIPARTGVSLGMKEFLERSDTAIPSLAGIKYSIVMPDELMQCLACCDRKYNMLYGSDQTLLAGIVCGAHGAVGSTYNFAAPLFNRILDGIAAGDLERARLYQLQALGFVETLEEYPFLDCCKVVMGFLGIACGRTRLPNGRMTDAQVEELRKRLEQLGFFNWNRKAA